MRLGSEGKATFRPFVKLVMRNSVGWLPKGKKKVEEFDDKNVAKKRKQAEDQETNTWVVDAMVPSRQQA